MYQTRCQIQAYGPADFRKRWSTGQKDRAKEPRACSFFYPRVFTGSLIEISKMQTPGSRFPGPERRRVQQEKEYVL